jgi:triacylglycerol lipase
MAQYIFHADISKFDPPTTRYRGENALVLADCAKLVYQTESEIREAMEVTWKFKNFKFFDGKSTQAFIAGNEAMIIIAFRGTEGKVEDIIADAKVKLVKGPAGSVHQGFNDALQEVWGDKAVSDDMRSCIKKFQDKNQSIWFCGHSLGAALATLATAEYVINDGGKVNGLYTIGQPRVGNDEFAARIDNALTDKYFRFVNNDDVVPRIPLPGLVFNYMHAGHVLYIDSNGNLHDSLPWWIQAWDRLKGVSKDIGKVGLADLKDHNSGGYVALIDKNRAVKTQWS